MFGFCQNLEGSASQDWVSLCLVSQRWCELVQLLTTLASQSPLWVHSCTRDSEPARGSASSWVFDGLEIGNRAARPLPSQISQVREAEPPASLSGSDSAQWDIEQRHGRCQP